MGRLSRKSLDRSEQDHVRQIITEARKAAKVSQRELSRRLGQSAPYASLIERGERTVDVVEFIDIARALEQEPLMLFVRVLQLAAPKE